MYGPLPEDIDEALSLGLKGTIDLLLHANPMPAPPVNYKSDHDQTVSLGETWIDQPYISDDFNKLVAERRQSLSAWQMGLAIEEGISIREKMTLFWHNHFVTAEIQDATYTYQNISKYRENFLGNFRELTKVTTIDPAMLRYLNGNQNHKNKPNENYARELLELFTIGKGPLVAQGDYTNYTEEDILAVSKVLTGWSDSGYFKRTDNPIDAIFYPNRHDTSTKTLSHRFNNAVITDMGDQEHEHLIDIIFMQEEVSKFIARKIYRWFLYYEIDENIEQNIINPLAQVLRDNDYEMYPMVETLLMSEHFYDEYAMGCQIKNPIDYVASTIKQLRINLGDEPLAKYPILVRLAGFSDLLQMAYFYAPSVSGWKAYYQPPLFYRDWINSATLSNRLFFAAAMLLGIRVNEERLEADLLSILENIDRANDPNILIESLTNFYYPKSITNEQKDYLKSLLIPGLPDYEWTVEYDLFRSNPDDEGLRAAILLRLKAFFYGLLSLPEYQLI